MPARSVPCWCMPAGSLSAAGRCAHHLMRLAPTMLFSAWLCLKWRCRAPSRGWLLVALSSSSITSSSPAALRSAMRWTTWQRRTACRLVQLSTAGGHCLDHQRPGCAARHHAARQGAAGGRPQDAAFDMQSRPRQQMALSLLPLESCQLWWLRAHACRPRHQQGHHSSGGVAHTPHAMARQAHMQAWPPTLAATSLT